MSFDATNPEHHQHFSEIVLRAITNDWLGNAMIHSRATEGRPLTQKQEQDIRDEAEKRFTEWLAEFWQNGHDTALINGQSKNPYSEGSK